MILPVLLDCTTTIWTLIRKTINYYSQTLTFLVENVNFQKQEEMAALIKENCVEHTRRNFAENSAVPRSIEDYITQIFEEIEGRVLNRLSQKFSRTKNRILGALSRLDDFVMNPLSQRHSGTAPKTSVNVFSTNQGTNEDDSHRIFHPEADIFRKQTTRNSSPEEAHDSSGDYRRFFSQNAVNAVILRFDAVNAAIFFGWTPLTPLFFLVNNGFCC